MKVSVIIPVYNVEEYLVDCLESAVNQTLKDIEIICVNDGSTDSSRNILREYEEKYSHVKVVDQENKGLSGARNSGLKYAQGKYVYFLDSDDYIELNSMESCYNDAEKNRLDIVAFDAESFYDSKYTGEELEEPFLNRSKTLESRVMAGQEFYVYANQRGGYTAPVWLNFYRKKFLEDNKLFFYEGIVHEDEIHTSTSFIFAKRVKYIPNSFLKRRIRNNSIMTSKVTEKRIDGNLIIAEESYKLFCSDMVNDETRKYLMKWIQLYYSNSIRICDILGLISRRNEVKEIIKNKNGVLNINLSMQINAPTLFYSI